MDNKGVVTFPRLRTRKQAADFYRDLHASLKGKKRIREESVVVNNEHDFVGCEISDGGGFNGGSKEGSKRGANREVDVKSADSVLLSDDSVVECLGEEVVSNGSSFIVISESESGSCSKIDDPGRERAAPTLLEISSTSDEDMPSRNHDAKTGCGKHRFPSKNPSYDSKPSVMVVDKEEKKKKKKNKDPVPDLDRVQCTYSWKADKPIIVGGRKKTRRKKKKKEKDSGNLDFEKILADAMHSSKTGLRYEASPPHHEHMLPLKFRFEDEVEPPPEKTQWEEHMDSLFGEMEFALRLDEPRLESTSLCEDGDRDVEEDPELRCSRGDHVLFLDEQIGITCLHCAKIVLDIKYVLPSFRKPRPSRRDRRADYETSEGLRIHDGSSPADHPSACGRARGTVWDLLGGVDRELYPHQREGVEFIWKNIGGGITLNRLHHPPSDDDVRGCIISHAPGTGKTRLSIVFLQSFLRLYPASRPVIVAPRGMLLTWESEFRKWKADIPFRNMNREDLVGDERLVASKLAWRRAADRDSTRLAKLSAWIGGGSVLGISYALFVKLAGDSRGGGLSRRLLLEYPDVLVLDEGHTPRNDSSKVWNALMEVSTRRRVILSGTPFQNNLRELYGTLRLVNPGVETEMRAKMFRDDAEGLRRLKPMIQPFLHIYRGSILRESLPGLRSAAVFLKPTELQKQMIEDAAPINRYFSRIHSVSRISVHPSVMLATERFESMGAELERLETDAAAGVKTMFVIELIALAGALGEKVLIFSQYIAPLVFVMRRIESRFSWREGKEVVYMSGRCDERERQEAMTRFNDEAGEARVMLAAERACSEGINLAGASRVVLLDTVWNPSVEKQAISRAYRIGQKRVVYVYRLFTSRTEMEQLGHQVRKNRIADAIISDGRSRAAAATEKKEKAVWQDEVLDAMRETKRLGHIFERVVHQGEEDDFVDPLGLDCGF